MRTIKFLSILFLLVIGLGSCEKNTDDIPDPFHELEKTAYYDSEIFDEPYLKVYGKWELFDVSGGFTGMGHDLNFEYLEIKEFGIYGFFSNDSLLEYGKISPALQSANEVYLKVNFEKDENSGSFFSDYEKYILFSGSDTLHLNSPCCDRYNYHFKRVEFR